MDAYSQTRTSTTSPTSARALDKQQMERFEWFGILHEDKFADLLDDYPTLIVGWEDEDELTVYLIPAGLILNRSRATISICHHALHRNTRKQTGKPLVLPFKPDPKGRFRGSPEAFAGPSERRRP